MLNAPGRSGGQTGTKILMEAMSKDKVHLARFVLDALDGQIVDSKTDGAQTPLITSILLPDSHTRSKFVELLLQRGANVNYKDGVGRTALSYACERGYVDVVKILVQNNADPEIVDSWGNTALMYAAVAGHSRVVEFLVRAFKRLGLQIDRQNKAGNSAVGVAKFLGHTECIFALTNNFRRSREAEGGARRNAQPRLSFGCNDLSDKFERRLGLLVNKLEVLHSSKHTDKLAQNCTWQPRSGVKQSRMPAMGSIEEFDRENDGSASPPQELVFSGVLTPKPPSRSSDHPPNPKPEERLDNHLPPLVQSCEPHHSNSASPWPGRNAPKPSAPSALGLLMTPIPSRSESDQDTETSSTPDVGARRFHESYYQKRCSLPASVFSPTPPERSQAPLSKSRAARRREVSPCKAKTLLFTAAAPATSATTLSVLSSKLLRRFTSPEFKKEAKELEEPVLTSARMSRSETFPQGNKHPQVGSKPSIDSISSVKCEFDFHFRIQNS